MDSGYTKKIKQNILKLYEEIGTEVFGNSRVVEVLGCSEVTATAYLKRMEDELKIIVSIGVVLTSFTKGKAQPQNTAFVINKAGNMVIVWFNPVAAFTVGKLKVDGDIGKALEFSKLLKK